MKKLLLTAIILPFVFCANAQVTATDHTDVHVLPTSNEQTEVHISFDPNNGNNIIMESNIDRTSGFGNMAWYESNDGGDTWCGAENFGTQTDPSTAFDAEGKCYVAGLDGSDFLITQSNVATNSCIAAHLPFPSTNPVSFAAGTTPDKEMIAADNYSYSHYVNSIYGAFDYITPYGVGFDYLTTWPGPCVGPRRITTHTSQGSNVQTGLNGEVYVCWYETYSNKQSIGFAKSLDGGNTFPLNISLAFRYYSKIIN